MDERIQKIQAKYEHKTWEMAEIITEVLKKYLRNIELEWIAEEFARIFNEKKFKYANIEFYVTRSDVFFGEIEGLNMHSTPIATKERFISLLHDMIPGGESRKSALSVACYEEIIGTLLK